jgi:hypothetical protein
MSGSGDSGGGAGGNAPKGASSVWDTLAAMKARHTATETKLETARATSQLKREAIAVVERSFTAGVGGHAALAESLGKSRRDTDPAIQDLLDAQAEALRSGGAEARRKEISEIVALQQKAVLELERAKGILSRVADERELTDSRAGRLEYKVRD